MQHKVVQVAKQPARRVARDEAFEQLATLCFYYPQYSFAAARKLPHVQVRLLLKRARQLEAARYLNLTQIAAAPHSKNGKGVKKLTDQYKGIMKNG